MQNEENTTLAKDLQNSVASYLFEYLNIFFLNKVVSLKYVKYVYLTTCFVIISNINNKSLSFTDLP